MLEINISQKKSLTFELQVTGIDYKNINGSMILELDGVEYGFPITISENSVSVEIPPLKNIVKREINHGEKINSKLSINGEGFYLSPWVGEFEVRSPVQAEAKIVEKSTVKASAILGEEKREIKTNKTKIFESPIQEKKIQNVKPEIVKKDKTFEELREDILNRKEDTDPVFESNNVDFTNVTKKTITDAHIYKMMEIKGTTSKSVQKMIYEQCQNKVGDNKSKIFEEVSKFYKTYKPTK